MKSYWDRLLALGDSDHTAKFQKLCGIRSHGRTSSNGTSVSQSVANGTYLHKNGHASSALNSETSSVVQNGSINHLKTVSNGHVANGEIKSQCNGSSHDKSLSTNGSLHEECKNGHVKNGHSLSSHAMHNKCLAEVLDKSKSTNGLRLRTSEGKEGIHVNGHVSSSSETGVEEVPMDYTIENNFLYYIFSFGASLGNEVFYVLFFSFSFWNFDAYLVRKASIAWCVIMYLGQAAKDVIRWPRPTSPPVVRLEERYELEYGMPSTHAMVGVAIPFSLLFFAIGRYEFNMLIGLLFAITWTTLVSFSRLYLGMHSCLDILAGIVLAFVIMGLTIPFVEPIDKFLIMHPYALPVLLFTGLLLCLMYPTLDKWSTARGDTTQSLAVFSGLYAGLWLTGALTDVVPEPDAAPYVLGWPSAEVLFNVCVRQVIGVIFVMFLLTGLKVCMLHGLCAVFGLDPKCPESKKKLIVELPYKYVSYGVASFAATYLAPIMFLYLNIERLSFYSEIFIYRA